MKTPLLVALICCLASPAWAKTYSATYDVYAGGIHALQARMTYTENKGRYDVALSSETYGLLGKIVPWHASFKTKGWVLRGKLQPEQHVSDTTSKGKHEVNTYNYSKTGKFLSFSQIVRGKDETRDDLGDIMQGTTDVLSANFNAMKKIRAGEGCSRDDMIFDSERSYRLMFRDKGRDVLSVNKYSRFSGEASACVVEVKPEGGKWHKKPRGWLKIQEQARKAGQLPTLWFSDLANDKTAPVFPVKIMIKTDYGTFLAHLTSFEEKGGK